MKDKDTTRMTGCRKLSGNYLGSRFEYIYIYIYIFFFFFFFFLASGLVCLTVQIKCEIQNIVALLEILDVIMYKIVTA